IVSKWCIDHNLSFIGLPRYVGFGLHNYGGRKYRFLVMDRFGDDLQSKIMSCKIINSLSMRLTLWNTYTNMSIHADIKASNLLSSLYVLADFGLSYRYTANGVHTKYTPKPKKCHSGTIEFTSRDAHVGADPSRRGDFEILVFGLIRWLCGFLPWDAVTSDVSSVAKLKDEYHRNIIII
ncbi:serine/threonine-protein kinase VRK1-like, partial [Octopus sinensis]|uniref:Serine/threonine-protein kinase VRK1-like n=1 Tax=Octopus sinensis TaxID=2607531 RepID=A0A6P7U6D4_9MOLL